MNRSQADSSPDSPSKRLVLMRHAKSDWSSQGLSDHQRPLNRRGQRDAPDMARWLCDVELCPDHVLCSSAVRTRETLDLMTSELVNPPTIDFSDSLYCAPSEAIAEIIRDTGGEANRLLVLAHNPGMSDLVSTLSGQFMGMPTAAIAVFELQLEDWQQFHTSMITTLIHFMRPKALSL
ncbi:SixA phosphatase family protein [Novipirellula artificiosorum]|uniref:Phosphohistidine phosphatase n=1 Tax=Novipirellula artificiosorum TaxID=2528016 RepID=A0A5C6DBX1_9BACT|nr:histidine phosphatase family protein [Novipirellula artificiosorum]TWU33287.1 phosphohistidine phosphatase [Novipirellula artificiosorum]